MRILPPRVSARLLCCLLRRADLADLRRELKAALQGWEREQAIYAEARGGGRGRAWGCREAGATHA